MTHLNQPTDHNTQQKQQFSKFIMTSSGPDAGKCTALISLDLSAAFDTVIQYNMYKQCNCPCLAIFFIYVNVEKSIVMKLYRFAFLFFDGTVITGQFCVGVPLNNQSIYLSIYVNAYM